MMETLVFTLAAPMASFGELAGTVRSTARTPSFSAVIGLLGAALGLPRADAKLLRLARDYAMAVRIDRDGGVMTDFHTVQTPHSEPPRGFRTRRDELEVDTGTVITRRVYRQDVEYTVALFAVVETPDLSPSTLADALRSPRYPLYAGRRSCQLSQPPNPRLIAARDVSTALGTTNVVYDARLDGGECKPHHSIERHDMPTGDRQFRTRTEYVV